MNTPKLCIPVTGTTIEELVSNAKAAQQAADCIEIRADAVESLAPDQVAVIRKACHKETIFTCRHSSEGGFNKITETTRHDILQAAIDAKFEYVDIELKTFEARGFTVTKPTKLILSFHDFLETPTYWDLTKIIDDMKSFHPDVMKIATMVNSEKDVVTLTRVLVNKLPHDQMIVLGMGEHGRITRLMQPFLGGYLTYVSLDKATAPGQIDIKTFQDLYKTISSFT